MKVYRSGKTIEISVVGGRIREELFAVTLLLGDRPERDPHERDLWNEFEDGEVAVFEYDAEANMISGCEVDLSALDSTLRITRLDGLLIMDETL